MRVKSIGTAMATLVAGCALAQSTVVVEEWNYTGNSLTGDNGTAMTFVSSAGNVDETGGAKDNTYTVNRDAGFSGTIMSGLNISTANTETVTISFTMASWDLTKSGNNGYWGIRIRNASNTDVAHFRFLANAQGTVAALYNAYGQITDSGANNRTFATGGVISTNQAVTGPVTVSLTLDLVNGTYAIDSTVWDTPYTVQASGTIAGLSGAVIDNFSWAWANINDAPATNAPNGDFVELDQISLTKTVPDAVTPTYGETLVEQWDFTGDSLVGSNGNTAAEFDEGGNVDDPGNNTWTLNRTAWNSDSVLSGLNITSNTADKVELSMTFSSWNFTNYTGGVPSFSMRLRNSSGHLMTRFRYTAKTLNTTNAVMTVDGFQYDGGNLFGGTFIQGGEILSGHTGSGSVTVGFTIDYVADTFTFWLGDPDTDDGSGWLNRYAGQYTGSLSAGFEDITIDNLTWMWSNVSTSLNHFVELDQIRITTYKAAPIPEGYEGWILDYPGVGVLTNKTDNPDGDALNNLYEYALGGNPASNDTGYASTLSEGSGYLEYIHVMRNDDETLTYYLVTDNDLVFAPGWTNSGYTVTGINTNSGIENFDAVTNQIPTTEDQLFFKLMVE